MVKNWFYVTIVLLFSVSAWSRDLLPANEERQEIVRRAEVWFSPAWIDGQFKFADDFSVLPGPALNELEILLQGESVDCFSAPEKISATTGFNPKFSCNLLKKNSNGQNEVVLDDNNEPYDLKVKYGHTNGEVYGEVLATRLFWALGFGADRMFSVLNLNCFGCTAEPFSDRRVDETTLITPRVFSPAAIEKKFKGDNIQRHTLRAGKPVVMEGWGYQELLQTLPRDPILAHDQLVKREALTLLVIFVNHLDNRKDNQRLVCLDGADAAGTSCTGRTAMIVHDLGSTFGSGMNAALGDLMKVDFNEWSAKSTWTDASICEGGVSAWGPQDLRTARVSEEGRQFLVKLLKGFSEGPFGRKRVQDLFRSARIELRSPHTVDEWTDLFLRKVREVEFPMGEQNPNFVCP